MFYTKANTFLFKRIKYEGEFWKYKFWQSYKDQTNLDNIKGKNPDYALENVIASLYGTLSESSIYDSETSKEIGAFLRAQIGDFNSNERTLYLRKLGNDRYLFTGNEAVKVRKLDSMYLYQMSEYKAKEKRLFLIQVQCRR